MFFVETVLKEVARHFSLVHNACMMCVNNRIDPNVRVCAHLLSGSGWAIRDMVPARPRAWSRFVLTVVLPLFVLWGEQQKAKNVISRHTCFQADFGVRQTDPFVVSLDRDRIPVH